MTTLIFIASHKKRRPSPRTYPCKLSILFDFDSKIINLVFCRNEYNFSDSKSRWTLQPVWVVKTSHLKLENWSTLLDVGLSQIQKTIMIEYGGLHITLPWQIFIFSRLLPLLGFVKMVTVRILSPESWHTDNCWLDLKIQNYQK